MKKNLKNRKINVGRRSTLKRLGAIAAYSLGFPYINFGSHKLFASTNKRYSNRSISLVTENIVIDMLGLITLNVDTQKRWGSASD